MYVVRHFAQENMSVMRAYLAEHPLAALVVNTVDGPSVDHLPLEFDASYSPGGHLLGHIARSNPLWGAFESAPGLAVFSGHQAGAVVGVELEIDRMVGKWKLSQNRPRQDRDGVMAGLRREGGAGAAALADLMASQAGVEA